MLQGIPIVGSVTMLKAGGREHLKTSFGMVDNYRKGKGYRMSVYIKQVPVVRVPDVTEYYLRSIESFFLFSMGFMATGCCVCRLCTMSCSS